MRTKMSTTTGVRKKTQPPIKHMAKQPLTASSKTDQIKNEDQDDNDTLAHQEIKAGDDLAKTVSLPDPATTHVHPDEYLARLVEALHGYRPIIKSCLGLEGNDFFPEIMEKQLIAYDVKVVSAARDNDLDQLKSFHDQDKESMTGCNRFGESILHLACRRGFEEMVNFLLEDADGPQLSVRIRDDCGRTPFHDACWNPQVQLKICSLLIQRDATLLLLSDKRGHSPFQYARQEHWPTWRNFLYEHYSHVQDALADKRNREIFSQEN